VQLRYFEVGPGGHTTLERHRHVHLVWISRGKGMVFLEGDILQVNEGDVLSIPTWTWHQFHAPANAALGFHCLVAADRDKPSLPGEEEWALLTQKPAAAALLKR
jgi:mannose-6-phosphate isomerase-like protein (cupin superfamily)